ncbi:MAG: fibronectin type III domain-containing protein, partial [Chlorobi bacterium]|nr:fibronectin type III domain-containing protein [Chlorobiota bacterium]
MKRRLNLLYILLIFTSFRVSAQTYPVVSSTQILPPYSVYLSDYASAGSDKFIVNLFLQDQNQNGLQVKLKITITGDNGVKLETKPEYMPPPITLYAGTPEIISGPLLQQYLEPANLNITGLNPSQFARDKKLPEGIYTFKAEAVEYRRNKLVSNSGTTAAWLILNDPPIWNLPRHNSTVTASNPQNIFFSWLPMHTGSPNSAFTTEYEFSLYDIIPQDRDPEEIVRITAPLYQSSTASTSLVYGPAEPPLEVGRKYAVRLRAYDTEGRDMFKNDGYSTVLVFTYGQECITPVGINHDNLTPHSADVHWTSIPGNTEFKLYYREKDQNGTNPWYEGTTSQTNAVITQLKPEHDYQYLVRALCGSIESEPSEIYEFTTPAKITDTLQCGNNPNVPEIDGSPPLQELFIGDVINVGGFEGIITQARGGNGVFSGKCIMRLTNFNILLKSHFDDIHINQSYQVTEGHVIADRGPGIMINLDDIIADLDSLGNIPIDSINLNPNDYINSLDSLVNNLPTDTSLISYEMEEVLVSNSNKLDLIDNEELQDQIEELQA